MTFVAQPGKDVTDTTKLAYILGGDVTLTNTGNALRWCVKFQNEYCVTLQGVQMIGLTQ